MRPYTKPLPAISNIIRYHTSFVGGVTAKTFGHSQGGPTLTLATHSLPIH